MQQYTLAEAATHLRALVDAAIRGEDVIIATEGEHAVKLIPVPRHSQRRVFGSARGLIHMTADFDAPIPDFESYV